MIERDEVSAEALAEMAADDALLPDALDRRVHAAVAKRVATAAPR